MVLDRHKDQRNKTENPEIDPHKYDQLIFDKDPKAFQQRKDSLCNEMVLEQLDSHRQKQKQNP